MLRLAKICFLGFIFLMPFRIDFLLWQVPLLNFSFFNPYLSHFLSLADLVFLAGFLLICPLVFLGRLSLAPLRKIWKLIALFVLCLFLGFVFSKNLANSAFYILRMLQFGFLGFLVYLEVVPSRSATRAFVLSVAVSAFVGLLQLLFQQSLGLSFFGESVLARDMLGVAKIDIFGEKFMRPYGFFPHPNIFAAYLLFGIFFIFIDQKIRFRPFLAAFFALMFVLTLSRSALLAMLVAFPLLALGQRKKAFSFSFFLPFLLFIPLLLVRFFLDSSGFAERSVYVKAAALMIKDNFLGVGVGNFTLFAQQYAETKLMPWMFQPVHNFFLLFGAEFGLVAFALFVVGFTKVFYDALMAKKAFSLSVMVALFTLMLFDHYFLSLVSGQFLFAFVFSLVLREVYFDDR